ncbi:hypothetical protein CP959_03885 [Aliarcobacter skirrowii CCUG 10374]|uniref:Uncharacterized protein n=1 Tax=Aliarcobacter skirrowii CCUG 10374 TaxID=1032239 RepID=A0AAD0WPQ2_9BACT|nr:hypothetical protein ASKIR_2003 [Aliarcobacter skirrowii CCUG 10374]RXI27243.1 hypothetical protein CP959_03885 [Aliarcobacter skirrowii CCUG 10374]HAC71104.1 hypothetical protein [Aliarcobacter skirrowii]
MAKVCIFKIALKKIYIKFVKKFELFERSEFSNFRTVIDFLAILKRANDFLLVLFFIKRKST